MPRANPWGFDLRSGLGASRAKVLSDFAPFTSLEAEAIVTSLEAEAI